MKRTLDRASVTRDPNLIWNAFVDLLAQEDYDDLSPLQRKAHLVFWYDSEVQNGGHGQYLENRGREHLGETVDALRALCLPCQAEVLSRAAAALSGSNPNADWADVLGDSVIDELDEAFHECDPDIETALQQHLDSHQAEYVDIA